MPPQSNRKLRFAFAAAFLAACACGWIWFAPKVTTPGWDFPQFYIAGRIPPSDLYQQDLARQYGRDHLAAQGVRYVSPYVRPAVFALPLRAVMWLPYWHAYTAWLILQSLFYVAALALLCWRFSAPPYFLALAGLFVPGVCGIVNGHDIAAVGLVLLCGVILLERGQDVAAGVLLGLCVYKPNLILLLPLVLALKSRWRALLGFGATAALLAAASCLLAPASRYLQLLATIEQHTVFFSPATMVGLRAAATRLGLPWLYLPLALLVAGVTLWAVRRMPLAAACAAAVTASLLVAYHVAWYDYTLLLLPLALALRTRQQLRQLLGCLVLANPFWLIQMDSGESPVFHVVSLSMAALLTLFWAVSLAGDRPGANRGGDQ